MTNISQNKINIFNQLAESLNIKAGKNVVENDTSIFNIFKSADSNSNGTIEGSEVTSLYGALELSNIKGTELNKLIEEYNKLYETVTAENVNLSESQSDSNTSDSSSGSTDSHDSGSKSTSLNVNNNDVANNANDSSIKKESEKSFEDMSLSQLESERGNKENVLKEAEKDLSDVYSGQNSAINDAIGREQNAKEQYDQLLEEAVEQNVIEKDLKQERDANLQEISSQESIINTTKTDIKNKDSEINNEKSNLSSAKSNLAALKSALESYGDSSGDDADEDGDRAEKRQELEEQIREEEENISKIEEKIAELDKEKSEMEKTLEGQELVLSELKEENTRIEKEITDVCQNSESELKMSILQSQQDYNSAKADLDLTKVQEETKAKESLQIARDNLAAVNDVYNKKKSSSEVNEKYAINNSEMKDIVNYFGENYLSVLSQEEIDKLIEKAKRNKMANIYPGKGSACLGICYEYEKWVTGLSGRNNPYMNENSDDVVEKMAAALNSGSPVIAKVNTKAGHRHFVLVIGIKQGATAPFKQSDFLCVDSYDGQVDGMGGSGNRDGNYRTLYKQDGQYWIGSRSTNFA